MKDAIISGIIGGLLTSIIIWVVLVIFKRVLIPWYQSTIYRGVILEGKWTANTTIESGNITSEFEDTLFLKQHGHNISGTYTCRNGTGGHAMTTTYTCTGLVVGDYLTLTYTQKQQQFTGTGTFLLKITLGGRQMKGCTNFVELGSTNVMAQGNLTFNRQIA